MFWLIPSGIVLAIIWWCYYYLVVPNRPFPLIFTSNHMKYIVIECEGKFYLCTGPVKGRHYFIEEYYAKYFRRKNYFVRGGGKILIDDEKKIIKAYDSSGDYGSANLSIVRQLLTIEKDSASLVDYSVV